MMISMRMLRRKAGDEKERNVPVRLDPVDPSIGRRGLVEPMRIDLETIYKRGKRGYFGDCNYSSAVSSSPLPLPRNTDTLLGS
jgi:hypothetical protein